MVHEVNAVITRRTDLAPGLWIIYVAPDGWELSPFVPGQYATLGLPSSAPRCDDACENEKGKDSVKMIRRAYSIASSPLEKRHLEFYLVLVGDGHLTPRLFNLHAGDRIHLARKITGKFLYSNAPKDVNLIFVATGTGIAPFISMLRTHIGPKLERRIALFHGVRQSADLAYREELQSMERLCPNFSYHPTVSRPQNEIVPWKGRIGHVQRIWESGELNEIWGCRPTPENTHIFLCGSPAMIDDMAALLADSGFGENTKRRPGQIHVERYW